jgi:formylglycine-generating enzyme required for sulfatase activity
VTAGDLGTGAKIGRYVIIEKVGTGAMGVVYGAYDPELDRKIALKLLRPGQGLNDTAKARLLREAKAIARLSHPNVVAVHDVGVLDDQVFLAMEFVAGGTIKSWLAEKPRTWRDVLAVFIAAGRGLVAAHAAGLVHRDFKPDNVLLDREGRPRVVDFGIARQAAGGDEEQTQDLGPDPAATLREGGGNAAPLLTLTKTGTVVGTPAYMAPEQFLGERGDERSDQFSFCVALYEALYGVRPFAGHDFLSISVNVTTEQLRPLPRDRDVPAWIRRLVIRGLKADPAARWASMAALIRALENDPDIKLRRRLIVGGTIALGAASLLVAWQMVSRRRAEAEAQIAGHVTMAESSAALARGKELEARQLRTRALAEFDATKVEQGEQSWRQARALVPVIDGSYDQAERAFETALMLDQSRRELRATLSELRYRHLLFAEDFLLETKARVLEERLAAVDVDGSKRKALAADGSLALRVTPADATIALERYQRDATNGRRRAKLVGPINGGESTTALAAGSYRLVVEAPGRARVLYPFEVARGQAVTVDLALPHASTIPDGFVFVPAGDFLFGDADEQLRAEFLGAVPIHRVHGDAYLIAQRETTYAEWIEFLNALDEGEQVRRQPDASTTSHGSLRLRKANGVWQLSLRPTTREYVAPLGEAIVYAGRKQRSRQDWSRFPVAGVSPGDVAAYIAWLRKSGRVPGARWCSELEWERAARGADGRLYPHGDDLGADDANFDATYGRVSAAYGPDVVGSHRDSRSPFDVDDLAGNVWEIVAAWQRPGEFVIRGGGYYFNSISSRSTNHEPVPSTVRDVTTGVRICSSIREKE